MKESSGNTEIDWAEILAAAVIIGVAILIIDAAGSSSGGVGFYEYPYDWDYLPGSGQWRCRGLRPNTQFAPNEKCAGLIQDDDRWPTNY